jgi:hypothetical protein
MSFKKCHTVRCFSFRKKVLIRENKAREREEEIEQIQPLLQKLEKEEYEEKEALLKQEEEQLKMVRS